MRISENLYLHQKHTKAGLAQTRIKITRRNINNLGYADNTTLMAESEEELKSLLMKVKEEAFPGPGRLEETLIGIDSVSYLTASSLGHF